MSRKVTRRKFLETTLAGSVALSATAGSQAGTQKQVREARTSAALDPRFRETLRAVMDEIIPAGDGMPAASAAGCLEYLDQVSRQEPPVRTDLTESLGSLERLCRTRARGPFAKLSSASRVRILQALELQSPGVFAKLRDHVYEAYYTRPAVWKLIGYEFHATNQEGPSMAPFDESVLAKVRKMPKLYREVS